MLLKLPNIFIIIQINFSFVLQGSFIIIVRLVHDILKKIVNEW